MKNQVDVKIEGIKCDNPNCDYKNMSVNIENFKDWHNKPCPKCGENLLGDVDYVFAKFSIGVSKIINKVLPKRKKDEPDSILTVSKDFDGKLKCTIKDDDK